MNGHSDTDAQVVIETTRFDEDFKVLTSELGFRVDAIFPADAPNTAVVSAHGVTIRLEQGDDNRPAHLRLVSDQQNAIDPVTLPGGTLIEAQPRSTGYVLPDNQPSLVVNKNDHLFEPGRAGMEYRDLLPDRWGGRFIASNISIADAGPIPDYVHFHKIRFQMIFVKSGWVRVVYEGQGEPFVMNTGDCVLQPPEIRHQVLECSSGFEVVEIGSPAEHETIADWSCPLPDNTSDPEREFGGQRFVRHIAEGSSYQPWRFDGWEYRDTGIGGATSGLAGARVARPSHQSDGRFISHDTEFSILVVLSGRVNFIVEGSETEHLGNGDSATIPDGVRYRLEAPSPDCELLDVTLPDTFTVHR